MPYEEDRIDNNPPRGNPFPVVGIGAGAGGLHAFEQLLRAVPANTGMAFVIVSHLDPQHENLLTEILTPVTHLPIETAVDGVAMQPNRVYVLPPNNTIKLDGGQLRLLARESGPGSPIDIFFRSLAEIQGSRAVGVVLSGNASDGIVGLQAIKAECGITLAQDENSVVFDDMPRNAIATGAVDFILSPAEIGEELGFLSKHPFLIPQQPGDSLSETLPEGDEQLKQICALLNSTIKVDFSHYKPTTIRRKIRRRMIVLRIDDLSDYVSYVTQYPTELQELYRDLIISATSFFHNPDSFEALKNLLTPTVSQGIQPGQTLRAWVPGCATGEEVYSLAIVLYEILENFQHPVGLQLFGTDISSAALDRARAGIYSAGIAEDISPDRLRRFFTKNDLGYQITTTIRSCCVFARQDVTRDPPISNLDLVSCRNLLSHLEARAQRRILYTFHYALKPAGYLRLGSAESVAGIQKVFSLITNTQPIYARKAVPSRLALDSPLDLSLGEPPSGESSTRIPLSSPRDLHKKIDRLIQSKYSPDCVVVNAEMQIVQVRGQTSAYLELSADDTSLNLLHMAKESLVLPLRRAVQAAASGDHVRESDVALRINDQQQEITIEVTPINIGSDAADTHFLIVFIRKESEQRSTKSVDIIPLPVDEQIRVLQDELANTRDHLRKVTEEYEADSEKLQAARREQDEQLRRSLEEKTILVREIHHRLKNTLQVIVSLLSIQSNQAEDPQVVSAFSATESRVRAIASIHERFYASDDLAEIEFGAYLANLARELVGLHSTTPSDVDLKLNMRDMVLHIEQAIPLGLIANELIINGVKHGLHGGAGNLTVTLDYVPNSYHAEIGETLDDGWGYMCVIDSGSGLPPDLNIINLQSMGFHLTNLLIRQLKGRLEVGNEPGAKLTISFPLAYPQKNA